ncbi:MAG TPA: MarR family winged helix-turn-helix transcriptional regulator [Ideonella sp.]|uniref:MarR family winged helix-turn-helix transcriptional regulator n=1 Tax=Ideonella sp. TaxID=1929293 RepID=UPI002E3805C0|nr:MarR family winged helix-turn-helix transcriptional regulator [Ideonella sp.]HEX5684532.1 MarR family winged helix-turn-helix transcriptional regulator [Ideonella sp.]
MSSTSTRHETADEPLDFGVLLNVSFGAFKLQLHRHLAEAGFGDLGPSFGYVFRLLLARPASLRDVADRLGISSPGALKVVDDMVAKGYVERRDDPSDRRVKLLLLTSRGQRAVEEARRFHAMFERGLAERLGARQVAAARAVLEQVVAHLSDAELEAGLRPS